MRKDSKVVISVAPDTELPEGWQAVGQLANVVVARSETETARELADANALFLWNFSSRILHRTGLPAGLSWIHTGSLGVDAVMSGEVVRSPVIVSNTRGVFERPIAEYVLGLMLAIAKDFRTTFENQKRHEWQWRVTRKIAGHSVALVGPGAIGKEIHSILTAVGYEVRAFGRRRVEGDEVFGRILALAELTDHLPEMDTVILALPLTGQTRGYMGAEKLERMKPGSTLINIGRGDLVDEAALLASLSRGTPAMAALDVFAQEPLPHAHPFWNMDQVIVSPHMSADTVGFQQLIFRQFAANLERWRNGLAVHNVVDKEKFALESLSGDR
jgi:phosphoglycerate dehydrogenase-like enzyme